VGYRGRLASVSGAEERNGISRRSALHGFAPVTTGALAPNDQNLYDILVCTDVLADSVNLQQCRNVINYDLPWNPMRLVQRHSRVDRIGSRHGEVYLRTFFPDRQLDAMLRLEERVRGKLAQAAASVGVEDAPIEDGAFGAQSFAETRVEIEKLFKGDSSLYEAGGTEGAAQTGESYRRELRKAIERMGDAIELLPWRIGSGFVRGRQSGHFFCATIGQRTFLRFVPRDRLKKIVGEIGTCLRLIECESDTARFMDPSLEAEAYAAWAMARESIFQAWSSETDPARLQPRVRKLNREVAEFLRRHQPIGMDQPRVDRCIEAAESPWTRRDENLLRVAWNGEFKQAAEKAGFLIVEIEKIGIEHYQPPPPLPPIQIDDVHLICWM
jgi:hypothetical protein